MVIRNYEALRMMMTAKFLEEAEKWQESQANQQSAFDIMDKELRAYLGGIRHTVHVQCEGFGLADVGNAAFLDFIFAQGIRLENVVGR